MIRVGDMVTRPGDTTVYRVDYIDFDHDHSLLSIHGRSDTRASADELSHAAQCGTCRRYFADIYPSGRCPFEYEHEEESEQEGQPALHPCKLTDRTIEIIVQGLGFAKLHAGLGGITSDDYNAVISLMHEVRNK